MKPKHLASELALQFSAVIGCVEFGAWVERPRSFSRVSSILIEASTFSSKLTFEDVLAVMGCVEHGDCVTRPWFVSQEIPALGLSQKF